jgi:hypothetical protein
MVNMLVTLHVDNGRGPRVELTLGPKGQLSVRKDAIFSGQGRWQKTDNELEVFLPASLDWEEPLDPAEIVPDEDTLEFHITRGPQLR